MNARRLLEIAVAHHQAGRLGMAESIYRELLKENPVHADALHLTGVVAHQTGQNEVALDLIERAISVNPRAPAYRNNLGNVLTALGRLPEAVAAFQVAAKLNPRYFDAQNNLGNALHAQGRLAAAIVAYRAALSAAPNDPEISNNLANVLKQTGQLDEAIALYRAALGASPQHAAIHNNLGNALADQGSMTAAIACLRTAVTLRPESAILHSNLLYALLFDSGYDHWTHREELQRWNQKHAEPLAQFALPHANDRDPRRTLRIGYVSAHFRQHVVGRNILPVIESHDSSSFVVHCYAQVAQPDELTTRFQTASAAWRNIAGLSDAQVADLVRRDNIDILVDLTLHMEGSRLLVFARKPAPVQVTFAGYPGSTGLRAIDYRLTDPHLDPPESDAAYSENSFRLPHSFWCYAPLDNEVATGPLPAAQNGFITFGCLNNFWKVTSPVLQTWAEAMRRVDRSRLILLCPPGHHRDRVRLIFQERGVDPGRIEFVARQSRRKYFMIHNRIDIILDTFPYNGHTTSCDAAWMGVPLVTLAGPWAIARAGLSILTNLGLPDLATRSAEEFIDVVVRLAGDRPRLVRLREDLRQRMQNSVLMDAPGFTRAIEAAYREMWNHWCAQSSAMG